MDNILIQAVAAAMFAKVLVDMVKLTPLYTVGWVPVALALLFGEASAFLLAVANGTALTAQMAANCALVGVLAAGSAVGVTELQKKAEEKKEGN